MSGKIDLRYVQCHCCRHHTKSGSCTDKSSDCNFRLDIEKTIETAKQLGITVSDIAALIKIEKAWDD